MKKYARGNIVEAATFAVLPDFTLNFPTTPFALKTSSPVRPV